MVHNSLPNPKSSLASPQNYVHTFFWGFLWLPQIFLFLTSPFRIPSISPLLKIPHRNFLPSLQRQLQRGRIDRFREICADFAWKAKRIPYNLRANLRVLHSLPLTQVTKAIQHSSNLNLIKISANVNRNLHRHRSALFSQTRKLFFSVFVISFLRCCCSRT